MDEVEEILKEIEESDWDTKTEPRTYEYKKGKNYDRTEISPAIIEGHEDKFEYQDSSNFGEPSYLYYCLEDFSVTRYYTIAHCSISINTVGLKALAKAYRDLTTK